MNGFQIGTLVLAGLLVLFALLDYKEQKRFNDYVIKKPCSCKGGDHNDSPAPGPTTFAPNTIDNLPSGTML